jgi:isopenicillin N synthase-like dioxygenase
MTSHVRNASSDEVPLLDLAPLMTGAPLGDLPRQLDHACRTIGFFYVKNHGIPPEALNSAFAAAERFFSAPVDEKMKVFQDKRTMRGFMPQGINQHAGFVPDLKESFMMAYDLPPDDPAVVARTPLHGANQWPEDKPWFRDAMEGYYDSAFSFGRQLLRLLAMSLDLDERFFIEHTVRPMVSMNLFHYPPQPPVSPESAFGVAPHTDYGLITLLAQDPIGGLEIQKRDGEWIAAPYVPGTLVINIGDLLQRWTNDVWLSNLHRVINRTGKERYSIPMFYNLDYEAPVACVPTCCGPETPPRYEPISSGDYLVSRFKSVQKYEAETENP